MIFAMIAIGLIDKKYTLFYTKINKIWEDGLVKIEELFEKL
jgi:hypothetical protein